MRLFPAFALAAGLTSIACGPPVLNTPVAEIPKLATLTEVMDNQATTADPLFKRRGEASFSDADHAAFAQAAERLTATSERTKGFSKGPDFDALATKLGATADALGKAAAAKDAAAVNAALGDMKATCKECHSKFR